VKDSTNHFLFVSFLPVTSISDYSFNPTLFMEIISWQDFKRIKLCIGTIVTVESFEEAKNPSWILYIDLGKQGVKKSSAQITELYSKDDLIGKQVVCVTNFPPKQIGKIMSEVLVTGFPNENGNVVLCIPDQAVPNGAELY
jgi:tRNA-binding protein